MIRKRAVIVIIRLSLSATHISGHRSRMRGLDPGTFKEGVVMAPFLISVCFFCVPLETPLLASGCSEMSGVEYQMRLDKRRNKVVAMVVAFLHAHFDRVVGGAAGLLNQVSFELLF